jgi:two-component system, NtrC family, response regulator AtoC
MPEHQQIRALLAVSDEPACSALHAFFRARGDSAEIVPKEDLAARVRASAPHIVLLDLHASDGPLAALHAEFSSLPVVVVAPPSPEIAFYAAKCGASAMLTLPLDMEDAASKLLPLFDSPANREAGLQADRNAASVSSLPSLFSSSPRMAAVRHTIDRVAATSATVLIRGESGVGKEVVARMIFARSERSHKPFVKVNCAAIPNDLLESELFGYDIGAFTGANRSKPGKFELADGGTLFLDEIGEMHPSLQAKLLHVLQDGEFARLGSRRDTAVDVRVLCATNKLLEQRVAEGLFREDLFYRINVVTVHIPPLRERRDEIPILLRHFIDKYATVYSRRVPPLSDEIMKSLIVSPWPGNIRELENLCKRYVIVGDATLIGRELPPNPPEHDGLRHSTATRLSGESPDSSVADLPELPVEPAGAAAEPVSSLLEIGRRAAWQAERQAIEEMLAETRWNRREAARRLNVSYKALLNKIRMIGTGNSSQDRQQNIQ